MIATSPKPDLKVRLAKLLQTVSASRLNTFHTCRLQFYFRYVLEIASASTPARHVGSAVHHVLSIWNKARWRKQVLAPDELSTEFNLYWVSGRAEGVQWNADDEQKHKAKAWSLVEAYLQQTPILPNEAAEGVEVRVEAELPGLPTLVGILDLIRPAGRIVDFKTSAQTPNPQTSDHLHETQLSLYSVLYREATGKVEKGLELHHLVKLKEPKLVVSSMPPMVERQKTRLFKLIDSYVQGVSREDFVPSPSPMACACCEFLNRCRKWS